MNNTTYLTLNPTESSYVKRGFSVKFAKFCIERDLNPACVGSVARFNCYLRETK